MKEEPPDTIQQSTTACIAPEYFSADFFVSAKVVVVVLLAATLIGSFLRFHDLGAESFGEDELNKLQTVAEYREKGLTGKNGEHPFLMKGLQTSSIILVEKINALMLTDSPVSAETALRLPSALFGVFTILVLYLLLNLLFGSRIALVAAILWAVDPNAVGFNRIAKEDTFLLFFFLLASFFFLRSQKRAEANEPNWIRDVWLMAISFGAMMASKYMPHLMAIVGAYYDVFQGIAATRWRIGKSRWLIFFAVMGFSFVIFNPTILLPETWREMLTFSSEKRISHDSYEFMGVLYRNQMSLWLAGVPWYFYFVFILVKTPLATLFSAIVGLFTFGRKRLGDGRFFVFFWIFIWFFPFTFLGGKFVRYFAVAQPLILILAAIGMFNLSVLLADRLVARSSFSKWRSVVLFAGPLLTVILSLFSAVTSSPNLRLYTNPLGGGEKFAGFYFPHDEFYDASTAETTLIIAQNAAPNARVANETPYLFNYYFKQAGRPDLISISLSDRREVSNLSIGDFIVTTNGRRYLSNTVFWEFLAKFSKPYRIVNLGGVESGRIYKLDEFVVERIRNLKEN